jgi:Cft2 family RNA processing exonuclease
VSPITIQYRESGVWLPHLGLWLDPHTAQRGPERVFVSHAHSDHTAAHREVILSPTTARLMDARLGGQRVQHQLPFGKARTFKHESASCRLTLLPAGHIAGSAMAWLQAGGVSLLYTGDFKLRSGLAAEACDTVPAVGSDLLIMETTYGRPRYLFPPAQEVFKQMAQFCQEALAQRVTPVLLAYSLGKSQEVLCGLGGLGLSLVVHESVAKMTAVCRAAGLRFPAYETFAGQNALGKVLLWPPQAAGSKKLAALGKIRTAIVTGWALDSSCRFRCGTDAAFPLSDHADFAELLEMVKRIQPKKVLTLHGFAADFAKAVRKLGFEAQSLSEDEQLELPL